MRVLVVDDDADIRDLVDLTLSSEGYEVLTAPHGAAGLDVVERTPPDVILLDMKMPVMDGWAFARAYARLVKRRAPVIVLTAAPDAARRAAEVGADGYLAKPFDLDALVQTVDQYTN